MTRRIGVGILLVNREGKIWVNRENVEKLELDKRVGDLSFPLETQEQREDNLATARRAVLEECPHNMVIDQQFGFQFLCRTYAGAVGEIVAYVAFAESCTSTDVQAAENSELDPVGWLDPEFVLKYRCRGGVKEVIREYLRRRNEFQR